MDWIERHQNGYACDVGHDGPQDLKRFGGNIQRHMRYAGNVALWARNALHNAAGDWIGHREHYNRNCLKSRGGQRLPPEW